MPNPVSTATASPPSIPVEEPEIGPPPPPPRVVTLEPVYIEGDAGTQRLLARYDEHSATQDCHKQARDMTTSAIALGSAALLTATTIATGGADLVIAAGVLSVFGLSIDAGGKLSDLEECDEP